MSMHAKMRERRNVGRRREEELAYCRRWGRRLCESMTAYVHILACLHVLGCPGHRRWSLCCKPPTFLCSFISSCMCKFQGTLGFSSSNVLTLCCLSRLRRVLLMLPLLLPPQDLLALSHLLSVCLFSLNNFPFLQFLSRSCFCCSFSLIAFSLLFTTAMVASSYSALVSMTGFV